jgi:radical SAM protein with 4Fe4S-binding SPASM domain
VHNQNKHKDFEDLFNEYSEYRQYVAGSHDLINILNKKSLDVPYLNSPIMVGLNITNNCNQNCTYCFLKGRRISSHHSLLTFEEWCRVTDELDCMKVLDLYITGGEPLMNKYTIRLLKYIKSKNNFIRLGIQTNGTLINRNIAEKLSSLLNGEYDYIQVSLDTLDANIYRFLRGSNEINKVIKGIEILKENGLKIKVNTVCTKYNINELRKLYLFAHKIQVDQISFMPLFPVKNALHLCIEDYSMLLQGFIGVHRLCKKLETPKIVDDPIPTFPLAIKVIESNLPTDVVRKLSYYCPAGRTAMEIDSYGNVYPCPFLQVDDFVAGDGKYRSITDIWSEGKKWGELRYGRNLRDVKCADCKYLNQCRGACPAAAYTAYQTVNMPDSRCELYEA